MLDYQRVFRMSSMALDGENYFTSSDLHLDMLFRRSIWHPFWHSFWQSIRYILTFFLTVYLASILAFFPAVYLTYILKFFLAVYLTYILTFHLAVYLTYNLTFFLAFYLTYVLTWEFVKTPRLYIHLVFHDPPWAIFRFYSKTIRGKNDNVGYINNLCPDSWNPKFLVFPSFCCYLVLLVSSCHCLLS